MIILEDKLALNVIKVVQLAHYLHLIVLLVQIQIKFYTNHHVWILVLQVIIYIYFEILYIFNYS